MTKNILSIGSVCTGCGTCVAACTHEAISLQLDINLGIYVPTINWEACNNCGFCYNICPGCELDFVQLNTIIFGGAPENQLLGNFLQCYVGHASDTVIRYHSSSGGMITALLIYALEKGIIDGALVTRMRRDKPLEPEPFIAQTRDELIEASGSKYCPVPLNIALKDIIQAPDDKKYAIVGLPCHLHGIRKLEQRNKKLKSKIVLHIGIICNHSPNTIATDAILKKQNVPKREVRDMRYRTEGWPGEMKIISGASEVKALKCWNYIGSGFFTPLRCLMCPDATSELADISFGDAWLPEYKYDKIGESLIICRTDYGQKILDHMLQEEIIKLTEINESEVVKSQRTALYVKKICLNNRLRLLRWMGEVVPDLIPHPEGDEGIAYNAYIYLSSKMGSNPYGRKILISLPQKLIEQINRFQYIGAFLWYKTWIK